MTEQERLLQRREVLYRQIDVMTLFEEDFLDEMSKRELDYHIDKILDEIILIRKLLKEIGYDH
jgi:hypothetical protein